MSAMLNGYTGETIKTTGLEDATKELSRQHAAIVEKQKQVDALKSEVNKEDCELRNLTAKYAKQIAVVTARITEGLSSDTKFRLNNQGKSERQEA